jgi:GTP cyclohydrolase IB
MEDIQSRKGETKIDIDKVGVSDVSFPIKIMQKDHGFQVNPARINMYVSLPRYFKGTHMSRFIEVLNATDSVFTINNMGKILWTITEHLKADSAHMELAFEYYIVKTAPVSCKKSLMNYECRFIGDYSKLGEEFILEVTVPVTTLCPCSKEISEYGAHNQRSEVTVKVRFFELVWIEDIVALVEKCASSELYTLLKREDEKFITERAYENPMFVEDIVRVVAEELLKDNNITWLSVQSKNFESIHNHNAYAYVKHDRRVIKSINYHYGEEG